MGKNYYLCGGDAREGVPWASVSFRHKKNGDSFEPPFFIISKSSITYPRTSY